MDIYLTSEDAKAMRLGLGLTLDELAIESHMSKAEISGIETGYRKYSEQKMLLLQFVFEKLYSVYDSYEAVARMAMGKQFGKRINTKEKYEHYLKKLSTLKDS
jgi:transcriptional regulator with XRE-family HTH domain